MNKPHKDWTLGKIKAECEKHKQDCEPCPFYHDCFAALPSETKATLDEIIGGAE